MFDNILYIAIVLDERWQEYLKANVLPEMINLLSEKYDSSWANYKPFCHHMTLAFYRNMPPELLEFTKENVGKEFTLTATDIGYSDKAIAVKVETNVPSANSLKHVTLATNISNGGKPFDSNGITNWFMLKKNLHMTGRLKIFYKNS